MLVLSFLYFFYILLIFHDIKENIGSPIKENIGSPQCQTYEHVEMSIVNKNFGIFMKI